MMAAGNYTASGGQMNKSLWLGAIGTLALAVSVSAQWTGDAAANNAVRTGPGEQVTQKIGARSDGGCYVGWFDNSAGGYEMRVQRLDPAGVKLWDTNGLLISNHAQSTSLVDWDLIADSAGNCVLAFTDIRDGGDLDVFAYRIAPDGQFLWGPSGVQCSINSDFDPAPKLCQASDGDFVIVWGRTPNSGGGNIYMQRIAPDGTLRFTAGGIPVAGLPGERPGFAKVIASTNGDVIVAWIRNIAAFTSPRHLWAQKYSSTGAALWGSPTPTPIIVYSAVSLPIAYWPEVISDQAGGVVLAWHRSQTNQNNCLVQRIDAAGNVLFPAGGVVASTNTTRNRYSPAVTFLPASGETLLFWDERNSGQSNWGVYGQKVTAAGTLAWGSEGRVYEPVDAAQEGRLRCVATADGAMAFWFAAPVGDVVNNRVRGLRVNGAGDPVWPAAIDACSTISSKDDPEVAVAPDGAALLIWQDNRSDSGDVYGQRINTDGSLGNPPCPPDVNSDGVVDLADLAVVLSNFGMTGGASHADGDVNGDTNVDLADLAVVLGQFGAVCP
jgi:hypothetical protein